MLLREAENDSSHIVKPQSDAMPPKTETGDRYQLSGEIARGGMGAVLRGRDVDLGRDLAVKVLLDKYAHRPEVARRFVEEAQIAGQLQHPGVVPVYDIGRFGDRPFFTMKLVKGQTLSAILAARSGAAAERPRLLGIALKVSETLAYAHAKGVIHRDLKPANIMVGAFGEVQVMDWGLAKVLAEGGIADEQRAQRVQQVQEDETTIRTARSAGSTGDFGAATEMGSILGTPAYMPPEQANGEVENLNCRADVFGLGAILCEILTGRPPYVGRSGEEVRRKAANGDLTDAMQRLDDCGADAELIALTKRCLSPDSIDRPADAHEVTDGLSDYLNGVQERLRTAERERAMAEVRESEQRKKRKVQLALAAALIGLLASGGAFAFWRAELAQADREREARNAEAVSSLLGQAEEALKNSDADKADIMLEAAKKRSAEGGAENEARRVKRLDADLALLRELDEIDQFSWTVADDRLPDRAVVATQTLAALKRFGAAADLASLDAVEALVTGSAARERIILALDFVLRWQSNSTEVRALLRRLDPDSYRDAVRDAVLANATTKVTELAMQKNALTQSPAFAAFMGDLPAIPVERRRQMFLSALNDAPGNLSLIMGMANTYDQAEEKSMSERLRWYQAAIAVAPRNMAAHNNLGVALKSQGRIEESIDYYRRAITLDRKSKIPRSNLGGAFLAAGRRDEAIECFRRLLELDPRDAESWSVLGFMLIDKGELTEAAACCRKAIELQPKLAKAHDNLGRILQSIGEVDEAIANFRTAIQIDPDFATSHNNLGTALLTKGSLEEAIACYQKAIELDPKRASTHFNLANAMHQKDHLDEAIACYRKAIEIDPKLGIAHFRLGEAHKARGEVTEAIASFKSCLEVDGNNVKALANLGTILCDDLGDYHEAITCFRKAIALEPEEAWHHHNLGIAVKGTGDIAEAINCFKKAIELAPSSPRPYDRLGDMLLTQGKTSEAIDCFKRAIELGPKNASKSNNLGVILAQNGRLEEAVRYYQQAIEYEPDVAAYHFNLGIALTTQGQLDKGIACFRSALEIDPKNALNYFLLGNALLNKVQVDEAVSCYKTSISLEPNKATYHLQLGVVLCDHKRDYDGAIVAFKKAINLEPRNAMAHMNLAFPSALAAAGKAEPSDKRDDRERARLRLQAHDTLRTALTLYGDQLAAGTPADRAEVRQRMRHLQTDPDLEGIRHLESLSKLPAEEQQAFTRLWTDVAALLKQAETPTNAQ